MFYPNKVCLVYTGSSTPAGVEKGAGVEEGAGVEKVSLVYTGAGVVVYPGAGSGWAR